MRATTPHPSPNGDTFPSRGRLSWGDLFRTKRVFATHGYPLNKKPSQNCGSVFIFVKLPADERRMIKLLADEKSEGGEGVPQKARRTRSYLREAAFEEHQSIPKLFSFASIRDAKRARRFLGFCPDSSTAYRYSRRCGGQHSFCSDRGCRSWDIPKSACRPHPS